MLELKGKYNKDCKIFTDNVDNDAISLIYSLLDTKELADSVIRVMPDVSHGKDVVVGYTQKFPEDVSNVSVNPSYVGGDIGCSVSLYITDADVNPEDFPVIEHRVRKEIPMGFDINEKRQFDMKDFFKFVQSYYDKARSSWPEMINEFDISEKGFTEFFERVNIDEGNAYKGLSSVGGSNHYIEFGNLNDRLTFSIHTGSRNLGQKVCKYWTKIASSSQTDNKRLKEEIAKVKKTIKNRTERENKIAELKAKSEEQVAANGFLTGDNLKGYLTDMVITTAYALFNHKIISEKIAEIIYKINRGKVVEKIISTHNYIDFEDHIIRKGSIRAYRDELMVIPMNMRDGIVVANGKSNPDWNYSCSHGAGRKLSRSQAKKQLSLEEYKKQMEGVYSTLLNQSTLDESPMAYKDSEEIKDLISETCEILYTVKPVISIKSGIQED